jgi:hypothetical protein
MMTMATTKVSVTVNTATLAELRKLAGEDVNLSSLVDEALRAKLYRLKLLALLDEWDVTDPISPEDQAKGERLWQLVDSSSTPAPSAQPPKKKARSGRSSAKR